MDLLFSGIEISDQEKADAIEIFETLARKKKYLKMIMLHISAHKESGDRKKYSIDAKVDTNYGIFLIDASPRWLLNLAVKDVAKKISREINSAIKKPRGD